MFDFQFQLKPHIRFVLPLSGPVDTRKVLGLNSCLLVLTFLKLILVITFSCLLDYVRDYLTAWIWQKYIFGSDGDRDWFRRGLVVYRYLSARTCITCVIVIYDYCWTYVWLRNAYTTEGNCFFHQPLLTTRVINLFGSFEW